MPFVLINKSILVYRTPTDTAIERASSFAFFKGSSGPAVGVIAAVLFFIPPLINKSQGLQLRV